MKLFNAIATVLCPCAGLALSAYDDIKENGFLNSTTRKVLKYTQPSVFLADKMFLEDIEEKGSENSDMGDTLKSFLFGTGVQA